LRVGARRTRHDDAVHIYQSAANAIVLKAGDTLTGGDLLPGLRVPIAEFFASSTG
jgi:hypothetical protein